jgi:hypothetical protein
MQSMRKGVSRLVDVETANRNEHPSRRAFPLIWNRFRKEPLEIIGETKLSHWVSGQ